MKAQVTAALALTLSSLLLSAQTENKTKIVKIKKIENINGVERVTDSTYTTDAPFTLNVTDSLPACDLNGKKIARQNKIVIVTDEVHGGNLREANADEAMDEQVKKALKAAGVNEKDLKVDKMMVVDTDVNTMSIDGKKVSKVIVIKTVKVTDASDEDLKQLGKLTGISDNKLGVENMDFYPNPNTGKFNLRFNLKDKGNTEVKVQNMEGKVIYSETLKDFSGTYDKEIDISQNPKGVYFVRIDQGKHSQLKKIILE